MLPPWSAGLKPVFWRLSGSRARSSTKETRELDDRDVSKSLSFFVRVVFKASWVRGGSMPANSGTGHGWRLGGQWLADLGAGAGRSWLVIVWLAASCLGGRQSRGSGLDASRQE